MDFFENLGSKLNKVGSDTSKKVKSLSTITGLKLENSKLEKSLDEMLLNLGQRYFNKFSEAPDAEFADIIENIKSCKAQIDGNLAEIAKHKASPVPRYGGDRKALDIGIVHSGNGIQLVGKRTQPRSKDQRHLWHKIGFFAHALYAAKQFFIC